MRKNMCYYTNIKNTGHLYTRYIIIDEKYKITIIYGTSWPW
jgi:hypothetical protein